MPVPRSLCSLSVSLLAGPLFALSAPAPEALAGSLLQDLRSALGLAADNTFQVRSAVPDPLLGGVDVRVDQYYQGVRVMGGEAILHLRQGRMRDLTDSLERRFTLDPRPALTASEALAMATADLAPAVPFSRPPTCELVVTRRKLGPGVPTLRDALVYHIHTELDGAQGPAHTDYLVDAHTGAIARKWDSLETEAEVGEGLSQYSGKVSLDTTQTASGFELRDPFRGKGGNIVVDLGHGTSDSDGTIYTSDRNTWGDGANYGGGSTTSSNGQTAAVDAAHGLRWTWDYYQRIHQRNGIDGKGAATTLRVHYGTDYDNAFWSDDCFCMTFGDGHKFKSMEPIDVIGHEVSHGVCATTAGLDYFGESGGLNEANSDINGTMVEFYARNAGDPGRIGDRGGSWTMGEQLVTARHPGPTRYLFKPSLDGKSPDAWSADLEDLGPHRASGPMNRCFFFLSCGANDNKMSDCYTPYLPKGMPGLGNDKAARIWYRALTVYMTSGTDYAGARKACIRAAKDLHGAGSAEEQTVWNAFRSINVGPPWSAAGGPGLD